MKKTSNYMQKYATATYLKCRSQSKHTPSDTFTTYDFKYSFVKRLDIQFNEASGLDLL